MSNEPLGGEAELRLKVVTDLDKAIKQVDEFNESTGFSDKIMVKLAGSLRDTRKAQQDLGGSTKTGTAGIKDQSGAYDKLNQQLADYIAKAREVAKLDAVNGGRGTSASLASNIPEAMGTRKQLLATNRANNESGTGQLEAVERAEEKAAAASKRRRLEASRSIAAFEKQRYDDHAEAVRRNEAIDSAAAKRAQDVRNTASRGEAAFNVQYRKDMEEAYRLEERRNEGTKAQNVGNIALRYSLYDVANTTGVAAVATLALVAAYESAAIARERAFADVQRTAGFDSETGEIGKLEGVRDEILALTQSIPRSFGELSSTAAIGGQLGVDASQLAEFTEQITKFSTISGVATETSALKLGKLKNILGLGADGYRILAESIAFAGAESAATEDQILGVAAEIGPYARAAKFGAQETVGLATALSSLQLAPEKSRSAIQDLFRTIDGSVATGGEKLRNFAAISGMSADEFATGWKERPAEVFQSLVSGLGSVSNTSEALRVLGLDGKRTDLVLTSLSSNAELVADSFGNAKAGTENGFLDKAFAVTVETIAEKLVLLTNAVQNVGDTLGGPTLAAVAVVIDTVANSLNALAGFMGTNVGAAAAVLITILALLIGTLFLLVTGTSLAAASILAVRTALTAFDGKVSASTARVLEFVLGLTGMKNAAITAAPAVASVGVAGEAAGVGLGAAATGAKVLRAALISTGIGAVAVILGSLVGGLMEAADGEDELATGADTTTEAIDEQNAILLENAAALTEAIDAANAYTSAQAGMEGALFSLGVSLSENGKNFTAYSEGGRKNIDALLSTIKAMRTEAGTGMDAPQRLADLLAGLRAQLVASGAAGSALDIVENAMAATGVAAGKAAITSNSLAVGLSTVSKKAKEAAREIRTVGDYASDLGQIFSRSIDLRFGSQTAFDDITSKVISMKKASEDAKDEVEDLNAEIAKIRATIAGLVSDNEIQGYFLGVANAFGDTLRSAQIAQVIAANNAAIAAANGELADKNGDLKDAQNAVNMSLIGNSAAAIAARGDITALIGSYQAYIQQLAASGMSQEDLALKVAELRTQFLGQVQELGYSTEQIAPYALAFHDFATIIREFPREVTLEILGLDFAQAAINEFLARNANQKIAVDLESDPTVAATAGTGAADAFSKAVEGRLNNRRGPGGSFDKPKVGVLDGINQWFYNDLLGLGINLPKFGFAEGGYTGDGGKFEPKGVVHGGEFVFSKEATSRLGVNNLAFEHKRALSGYSGGGYVGSGGGSGLGSGSGIEFSPLLLQALEGIANRPVYLVANGKVLGQLVTDGNVATTRSV